MLESRVSLHNMPALGRWAVRAAPLRGAALAGAPLAIVVGPSLRSGPSAHLFNVEVVGAQRLLDLLLVAARRRLHGAAEPVQHALERELLHRGAESRVLCPSRSRRPRLHHSRPRRTASRFWRKKGRSLPRFARRYCAGQPGATPTPTRARHADDRRKLGEAPPSECTAMRCRARSIPEPEHRRTGVALSARPTHTVRAGKSATSPIDLICPPELTKEMNAYCV